MIDRSKGAGASLRSTGKGYGRLPSLVRCTSASAAAGSGVGAQCYPGVIVDPLADQTTQPELGAVWLTLMDDGGAAAVPTNNRIYECLLAGSVTATGTDTRPRAFGVADHAGTDPDASPTVRGYVSTGTQSFAGAKTFTGNVSVGGTLAITGETDAAGPVYAAAPIAAPSITDDRTKLYQGQVHTRDLFLIQPSAGGGSQNNEVAFIDSTGTAKARVEYDSFSGALLIRADSITFGDAAGSGTPSLDFGSGTATNLGIDGGTW